MFAAREGFFWFCVSQSRDLCSDRQIIIGRHTQNQQVSTAVAGSCWVHRAWTGEFCAMLCAMRTRLILALVLRG
jgi:hypothetical protein